MSNDVSMIAFTDRERRLIDNCKTYTANDPAGLPGHNLMVIVAKLANLLIGKELEAATGRAYRPFWHRIDAGSLAYMHNRDLSGVLANVWQSPDGWHYAIYDQDRIIGLATNEQDAKARVEMIFTEGSSEVF